MAPVVMVAMELPADQIEQERLRWERENARKRAYDRRHGRIRHDSGDIRVRHDVCDVRRHTRFDDYTFIGWDGEAPSDTGYSLLMSSEGHELCHPGLETAECFDLLIQAKQENPASIFIWFGGRYDWDEILRQSIPARTLARLKNAGNVWWHEYRLTECEGKIYTIRKGDTSATIYEIHGWFHTRYTEALRIYGIASPAELEKLESEKNRRAEFLWSEIAEIREYCKLELKLMCPLMNRIRSIVHDAGFRPRAWYGPSALARELLTKNKIKDCMAVCPEAVNNAACHAFAGGRFEMFRGGIISNPQTRDRNSAYMYAALHLPNLARGSWRHTTGTYEAGKFALYRIRYHDRSPHDPFKPQPLFRRLKNGNVCWPRRVEGWYWNPEAELVADNPDARFTEAWVFDEDNPSDRPFMFVREVYRKRLILQSLPEGNPSRQAEQAFKWALASIFGQLCRVVGWDRKNKKPPSCHQIEWAGWILSHCRAAMHREAVKCGDQLVSIDTDSVTATCDFNVPLGKELGEWKAESCAKAVFFQNGVYFTFNAGDKKWSTGKTRGLEKRKTPDLTPDLLIRAIETDSNIQLKPKRKYVTIKMALNQGFEKAGSWGEHPGNILKFGGGGKRYHNRKMCGRYCDGNMHAFLPAITYANDNPFDVKSYPRVLPWKQQGPPVMKVLTDVLWCDTDTIDDELWIAELIETKCS